MTPKQRVWVVVSVAVGLVLVVIPMIYGLISYNQGIGLYRRAERELAAKRFEAAIPLLEAASKKMLGPTDMSYVLGNLGWAYYRVGLDEDAIRDLTKSIKLNSEPMYVYLDRALAYHRKGQFERALSDYSEALKRDPNVGEAYRGRGAIFADRGSWSKAIREFSEAIRCEPNNDEYFFLRGTVFSADNKLDEAIADFDAAIGIDRAHAGAYVERASAYARKGNFPKGLTDVGEAIRQLPNVPELRNARAHIHLDRGMVDEALLDCSEALRIAPDYAFAFLARARAYAVLKDWDRALQDASRAIELNPRLALGHYFLGRAFLARADFDQAQLEFNQTLQLDPAYQWAIVSRAFVYSYRRESALALQELRRAVEQFPQAVPPRIGMAWFLATCPEDTYRDGPLAISEALIACDLSYWTRFDAVEALAAAYAESGDFDRAVEFEKFALGLPGISPTERNAMEDKLDRYFLHAPLRDLGPPGTNLLDEGIRAYAQGNYSRALRCFNALLPPTQRVPSMLYALTSLGETENKAKNIPWATPKTWSLTNAYYYRGLTYKKRFALENAITDFSIVLSREPNSALVLCERGEAYDLKKESARALLDFDAALQLNANDARTHALRADALRSTNQWTAALASVNGAIRLDPALALAYHMRAEIYLERGEHEKAIREFDGAARLDQDHEGNIRDRGQMFRRKEDYKWMLIEFRELVRQFPDSAYAENSLAWALATCPDDKKRNGLEAITHARKGCELSGWKDPNILDTLGAAYAESGDFKTAVYYMNQALAALEGATEERKASFRGRLALFEEGKPYRELSAR